MLKSMAAEVTLFDVVVNETVSVLTRRLHEQGRMSQVDDTLDLLEHTAPSHQITWLQKKYNVCIQKSWRLYVNIMEN
jgi:hypothetical protein